jgi:hypothetical protein
LIAGERKTSGSAKAGPDMNDEPERRVHVRTPESDEVLRRIGRNVVIFQQVESCSSI